MYIKSLVTTENQVVDNPTWSEIEQWIRAMDGENLSDLIIGDLPNGNYLSISGGNGGKYHVVAQNATGPYRILIHNQPSQGNVLIVFGGSPSPRPQEESHSLATVLRVVKTYAETGQLDQALSWRLGPATNH